MQRPNEVGQLMTLGLTQNEARILAGLGIDCEKFLYLSMFDLREYLIGIESRRARQAIMALRRLIAAQETFGEIDMELWSLVRPDMQKRFIQARVPYWYALSGSKSELLRIPGVGKKAWEYLQFLRSHRNALHDYWVANPAAFNQILIVPFMEGVEAGEFGNSVLNAHRARLMWPFRGKYSLLYPHKYSAPNTFMWNVLNAIKPAQFNHVAFYLPLKSDDEQIDFIEELIWVLRLYSPVPFQYEVFGSNTHIVQHALPVPSVLRFELIRSGSTYGSGVIELPTHGEWDIRQILEGAASTMHGSKKYTFYDVDLLRMRLMIEEAER